MDRISVAVVDDHKLVRKSVEAYFQDDRDIFIDGSYCCGEDLLETLTDKSYDLIILDLNMPGLNGVQVAHEVLRSVPKMKILFFTMSETRELMDQVLDCGAHGYIIKKAGHQQMSGAIKAIIHGGRYFSASALNSYINSFPEDDNEQTQTEPLRSRARRR